MLDDAFQDTNGCAKILFGVMASTCTGMHPLVHPANRPCWADRMRIYRFLCALDAKTLITGSCLASKEAMRMYTAMILSNMPATREAMLAARHPAGCLVASPFELPPVALVGGMTQLVRAARRQCVTLSVMPTVTCVARALVASLIDEQRKRKNQPTKKRSAVAIFYNISWLGRSQPLCVKGKGLVEAANSVFFQTFRSDFLPMWYHQSAAGHRVSRLDLAQHQELHGNNPALVLCRALPDTESLRVQRLVLSGNLFGVMTLRQAAALCGTEAVDIMDMGAEDAAKMLTMARVSAQAAQVLAYNLGAQTRRMQVDAVCRRLMQPRCAGETDEQAISRLPKTATHLMLCVACRRVANACQDGSGKDCAFNEIGAFFDCCPRPFFHLQRLLRARDRGELLDAQGRWRGGGWAFALCEAVFGGVADGPAAGEGVAQCVVQARPDVHGHGAV